MSNIEYGTKISGNKTFATYSSDDLKIEIPIKPDYTEEDVRNKIESFMLDLRLETWDEVGISRTNDVYYNKALVRQDYMVGSDEGNAIITTLQEKFSFYDEWANGRWLTTSKKNFLGEYEGYREPYKNHSITWYNADTAAPTDLLSKYKVDHEEDNLFPWSGIKFDLVTDEVMLKVAYNDIANKPQSLPNNIWYYAVTYMPDGTVGDSVDVYSHETESCMRKFCEDHNLEWPLPDDFDGGVLLWGLLFNKTTLEYESVKAYTCDIL